MNFQPERCVGMPGHGASPVARRDDGHSLLVPAVFLLALLLLPLAVWLEATTDERGHRR